MSDSDQQRYARTDENELLPAWDMFVMALIVGILGGVGSILFQGTIAFFESLLFYGAFGFHFEPEQHLAVSPWGWGVIFVPVVGAAIVTWITNTLSPESRGSGVPEVMHAIYYHGGRIRPITVVAKALASAVSIGSGGSVGREGPIIQIGSSFGALSASFRAMPARQRIVLVGAGAAAGIAATFNAPLGGLAFAVELLLVSVSALNIAVVASATVTATFIGRLYSGIGPTFEIPAVDLFSDHLIGTYQLLLCVPFGLLTGLAAAAFVRSIYWMEDRFNGLFDNDYLCHMSAMLIVGLMIYGFLVYTGEYYVAGVGYATVLDVLRGILTDPLFLLLLFAAKMLATALTLGTGASGGVFSPSLFLGATLGAAWAELSGMLLPGIEVDPVVFAVAGMAGMVGATTSAVVTAIAMIFEQTLDYSAILPIIITVALAYVVRVRLVSESIYTLKLARRGRGVPQGLQAAMSVTMDARKVMSRNFEIVEYGDLAEWCRTRPAEHEARYAVVVRDGEIYGLAHEERPWLLADHDADQLVWTDFLLVPPGMRWSVLMRALRSTHSEIVIVGHSLSVQDLRGVITAREIARAARDNADLME
jgi:CIC family chloride channel protein